jgi:hypothetical protein
VSRARGNALPNALARYLRPWWPYAEATGSGRNGRDITGTPGVAWEVKTADDFKRDFKPTIWVKQAKTNAGGDLPVVVYFPRGIGEAHTPQALAIMPLECLMDVIEEAGHTGRNPLLGEIQGGMT